MSDEKEDPAARPPPDGPLRDLASTLTGQAAPAFLSGALGGYRILRKLGEGGMGVVFEAEQQNPRRAVALKVIRGAFYLDEDRVRLFRREAQTLARLRHPGIATIFESGRTPDGQHYFAMELVRGVTLDRYLAGRGGDGPSSTEELRLRLAVFRKICEAVNYAHQRGVIHRDLKPSNILVARDTAAGAEGPAATPEVKILDFGLARIVDPDSSMSSMVSEAGQVKGTLQYMSPEQVRGHADEMDLRSDVYSLGVVLYEMLSGRLPYDVRGALPYAALAICEGTPGPLTARGQGRIDPDLNTITLKAMEKDPARRYQSALALAEDLQRYGAGQPILAHPPSTLYLLRKLVARHRAAVTGAASLVVLLTWFAVFTTIQSRRLARERDRANHEAETARQVSDFLASLFEVSDPGTTRGETVTAREILDRGSRKIAADLRDQPLTQARLMGVMGDVYQNLGLYGQAESLLVGALETRRREQGAEHADVALSLRSLGALREEQGRHAEAMSLHQSAVSLLERAYGPDHAETGWGLYRLGTSLAATARHAESVKVLQRAMGIFARDSAANAIGMSWCLNDLAAMRVQVDDLAGAEPLIRRALHLKRQKLGPNHFDVGIALNNLGYVLTRLGRHAEARGYLEEAVLVTERTLGPDHYLLAQHLESLAHLMRRMGRPAQARSLLLRAIGIVGRTLGPENGRLAVFVASLAATEEELGRRREALRLYARAARLWREAPGEHHFQIQLAMERYATLLREDGRVAEAASIEGLASSLRAELQASAPPAR